MIETAHIKSEYTVQQMDGFLLPDKLPYEVKYKKYKNRKYTAQQLDNFSLSDKEKDKNIAQQIDSFLPPDKLPYEVKYKGKKK